MSPEETGVALGADVGLVILMLTLFFGFAVGRIVGEEVVSGDSEGVGELKETLFSTFLIGNNPAATAIITMEMATTKNPIYKRLQRENGVIC